MMRRKTQEGTKSNRSGWFLSGGVLLMDRAGFDEKFIIGHERKELLVPQSHRLSIIDSVGLSPMNNYRLAVCNRTVSKESAVCSRGKASWLSWLRKSRMHAYVDADSDAGIFIIIMYMRT